MTLPGCACMDERFKIIYKKGKMFGCLHINWVFLFQIYFVLYVLCRYFIQCIIYTRNRTLSCFFCYYYFCCSCFYIYSSFWESYTCSKWIIFSIEILYNLCQNCSSSSSFYYYSVVKRCVILFIFFWMLSWTLVFSFCWNMRENILENWNEKY